MHRKWEGQRLDYFCITCVLFLGLAGTFCVLWWAQHFRISRQASLLKWPRPEIRCSLHRANALWPSSFTTSLAFSQSNTIDNYGKSPHYQPGHLTCSLFQCLYYSADKCSRVREWANGVCHREPEYSVNLCSTTFKLKAKKKILGVCHGLHYNLRLFLEKKEKRQNSRGVSVQGFCNFRVKKKGVLKLVRLVSDTRQKKVEEARLATPLRLLTRRRACSL
jgi:hypothetical protein